MDTVSPWEPLQAAQVAKEWMRSPGLLGHLGEAKTPPVPDPRGASSEGVREPE